MVDTGPMLDRLMGIETEYGLAVEGVGADGMGVESLALVRAYEGPSVDRWDYGPESPRRDLRGFVARALHHDPNDAQFSRPGDRAGSGAEDHGDRVLVNGARLYNDHGHPEYCTPECRSLADLVAHDRAGEMVVLKAARRRSTQSGRRIDLYKNNTDYHGASYGCHESYLMRRSVEPDALIDGLAGFLATRQLFAGAGKVGLEDGGRQKPGFQLSQRADFITVAASVDTLHRRPLVNTRDEPHTTPEEYRRLHVIVGDANRSEWATAIKAGTTSLVLALLEAGWRAFPMLRDAPAACRAVSRSECGSARLALADGHTELAAGIQRRYLEAAEAHFGGSCEQVDWVLGEWNRVLDDLAQGSWAVSDRVDWAAKRLLLGSLQEVDGAAPDHGLLQSLDLTYHNVDPDEGLSQALEASDGLVRLVTDHDVADAIAHPPADTRAALRGRCVARFGPVIRSISWSGVTFESGGDPVYLDLLDLVSGGEATLLSQLEQWPGPEAGGGGLPATTVDKRVGNREVLDGVSS